MRPLYVANSDGSIGYAGNKICKPIKKISNNIPANAFENRPLEFRNSDLWGHISLINNTINKAANEYFESIGAIFGLLPLITRMISSPGAIYGKEHIDYTADTVPFKLKWFNLENPVYLSESSQIYLELYLIMNNINNVYSIYNSFRKEKSDATHLSEFHHIEYEGKVSQKENIHIIRNLIRKIVGDILKHNMEDITYFLYDEDIEDLKLFTTLSCGKSITFEEALDILYRSTKKQKYKKFTSKYFGAWEEVKITSELDDMVMISEFPLYEIAFYHAPLKRGEKYVGENTDFIWPYYREFVGSGHRVRSLKELLSKARKFNLPMNDYKYYLESRKGTTYRETSGFGLGWERFLQGLLKMPTIHSVTIFPRTSTTIYP